MARESRSSFPCWSERHPSAQGVATGSRPAKLGSVASAGAHSRFPAERRSCTFGAAAAPGGSLASLWLELGYRRPVLALRMLRS